MTTQAQQKKQQQQRQSAAEHRFINAQGAEVKSHDEAFKAPMEISPEAVSTQCKLELHNGPVTFGIEVTYNPNTYPHVITGGRITSGISGAPWNITGGFIGEQIRLDAKRSGPGTTNTLTIVGEFQNPPAYRGTYGFDGATASFKHTTRYEC